MEIAIKAQALLEAKEISTAVVSMPCWELFDRQNKAYKDEILGVHTIRLAIEAGSSLGWEKYVGDKGLIVGIDHFGASAPYPIIYEKFGLTPEHIVEMIEGKNDDLSRCN